MKIPKPLVFVILDGFGISLEPQGNPVEEARKPTFDFIEQNFPFTLLDASGAAVGLPWGEAGNSEVGHLTIGAGRAIYHHLPRIISAIRDRSFFTNEAFLKAADHVKKNNSRLHIAGLISSGSVHSYIDHLYALLDFSKEQKISEVYIHAFSDGKDAPPQEGALFCQTLEKRIQKEWPNTGLFSVMGRNYALDRDEKWDLIRVAYELLTEAGGVSVSSIPEYLQSSYAKDVTDEFIEPAHLASTSSFIQENDALIFLDFREDSIRELARAFVDEKFEYFPRKKIKNLLVVTMTEYQKGLNALAVFPHLDIEWPLARVLSDAGLTQLHIAESQKYAHVTYFLNGGRENPYPGEDRILIPSIATSHFDEHPEMKAPEITAKIAENFKRYDVVIANFANADMVGHTGNYEASVKAVGELDKSLKILIDEIPQNGGAVLITGDHGNIEQKRNVITGEKLTEHSINPVPLYLMGENFKLAAPRTKDKIRQQKKEVQGILTDIAPTILELLQIKKPAEMTGQSLLPILTRP